MSEEIVDTSTTHLEAALKAKKALSKLYAKQTEAMDGAVDKAKAKFKVKIDKLIAGLPAEVAALIKSSK